MRGSGGICVGEIRTAVRLAEKTPYSNPTKARLTPRATSKLARKIITPVARTSVCS